MADLSRIVQLISDQRSGKLSEKEKEELEAWVRESPRNRELMDKDLQPAALLYHLEMLFGTKEEEIKEKLWSRLQELGPHQFSVKVPGGEQVPSPKKPSKTTSKFLYWVLRGIAACGIIVFTILFFQKKSKQIDQDRPETASTVQKRPTLSYGKDNILYLDSLPDEGNLVRLGKWEIVKMDKRHVYYKLLKKGEKDNPTDNINTTLFVPRNSDTSGLQVSLPDGSRAVLYSGSISLPLLTANDPKIPRKVFLNGNAIFEISHDADNPFLIETPLAKMKVRGTLFSIFSDSSKGYDSVLLYTGKLEVKSGRNTQNLEPGQLATIRKNTSEIALALVPVMKYRIPWKRDVFDFSHQPLRTVMERVRKWYEMNNVKYGRNVDTTSPERFNGGVVSKDQSLRSLLDAIEPNDMTFTVEDRTKTIYVNTK